MQYNINLWFVCSL